MQKVLSFEQFLSECKSSRVVSIVHEVFAGGESPVSLFDKLAKTKPGSFLLESADQGVWSRFSFIGVDVRGRLVQEQGADMCWHSVDGATALPANSTEKLSLDGLTALQQVQAAWLTEAKNSDVPLLSGLVGHIGWDVVSDLESISLKSDPENPIPRISFSMFKSLVVVDHQLATLLFVSNVFIEGQSEEALRANYEDALDAIRNMQSIVVSNSHAYLADIDLEQDIFFNSNQSESEFLAGIEQAKMHVVRGDVFQVVLSQRFQTEVGVDALEHDQDF